MLKQDLIKGEIYLLAERVYARQIMQADINENEQDKIISQERYREAASFVDETTKSVLSEAKPDDEIERIQKEMFENGECPGTYFSKHISFNNFLMDKDTKFTNTFFGEYFIILYQLAVEMLKNEQFSDEDKNSLINEVVENCVSNSGATRAMFSGNLELAKDLSAPELLDTRRRVLDVMGNFSAIYGAGIDNDINKISSEKQDSDKTLMTCKVKLAALNIQLMNHGLRPLELGETKDQKLIEAYDWAREKAIEYYKKTVNVLHK